MVGTKDTSMEFSHEELNVRLSFHLLLAGGPALASGTPSSSSSGRGANGLNNVMTRLEQVEKKLANQKPVDGPAAGSDATALRDYQMKLLQRLRQIYATMEKEGSSLEKLRQERDAAIQERDELKKQVDKLNYRVMHLKKHVHLENQL